MIFVDGIKTLDDLKHYAEKLGDLPLIYNGDLLPIDELKKYPFKITIHIGTMLTIYDAIRTAMTDLKRTGKLSIGTSSNVFEDFVRTMGVAGYQALEKKYIDGRKHECWDRARGFLTSPCSPKALPEVAARRRSAAGGVQRGPTHKTEWSNRYPRHPLRCPHGRTKLKTVSLTQHRARQLRHNQTDAEKKLWARLRSGGLSDLRFRRQFPIGNFIADFACPKARLVVELDGAQHLDRTAQDARRTKLSRSMATE